MDLGTVVATLGGQYIQSRYQQPPQQQPVFLDTITDFFTDGSAQTGAPAPGQKCGYVWNPDTGKWQKKSRRRRKRLATQSDLKDLAALKGVLGSGEAFKVWIATHS